jgi:hypothetical protein
VQRDNNLAGKIQREWTLVYEVQSQILIQWYQVYKAIILKRQFQFV